MKKYVKPELTCVKLRVEESIATVVSCQVGSCDVNNDGIFDYISPSGS